MTRSDIPDIMKIEMVSFPDDPWEYDAFETEIGNELSVSWVARDECGDIVGYIIYWMVGPEVHIMNIAVAPELRGRGIARHMMARAIEDGMRRGSELIALEVSAVNEPARAMYASLGFRTVGLRKGYYKSGQDAEVMILELDSPGARPDCP
jgi:ribosomal-protein-alanine N-acetyltransferase